MIRKQLYIKAEQERALKDRARELGISEAELVRWLLDGLMLEEWGGGAGGPEMGALDDFFAEADRLAADHSFPDRYSFDREELYEDRGRKTVGDGGDGRGRSLPA